VPYECILMRSNDINVITKYKCYQRHFGEATERSVAVCPLVIRPELGLGWLRVRGIIGVDWGGSTLMGSGKERSVAES